MRTRTFLLTSSKAPFGMSDTQLATFKIGEVKGEAVEEFNAITFRPYYQRHHREFNNCISAILDGQNSSDQKPVIPLALYEMLDVHYKQKPVPISDARALVFTVVTKYLCNFNAEGEPIT